MENKIKRPPATLDAKTFSDLLYAAKGKKSSIDFCRECDISAPTFSRYLNGKNKRSCPLEILKKIAAHADPASGVTLTMLIDANGSEDAYEYGLKPDISKTEYIGIITTSLFMKQYNFQRPTTSTNVDIMGLTYIPALTVETATIGSTQMNKWDFFVYEQSSSVETDTDRFIRQLLIIFGAKHLHYVAFDKLSFIFSNATLFYSIIEKTADVHIDACISLILIDAILKRVEKEHFITSSVDSLFPLSSGMEFDSYSTILSPDEQNVL